MQRDETQIIGELFDDDTKMRARREKWQKEVRENYNLSHAVGRNGARADLEGKIFKYLNTKLDDEEESSVAIYALLKNAVDNVDCLLIASEWVDEVIDNEKN